MNQTEAVQQAAAWLAGRLTVPVFTAVEAAILTGRPASGDDVALAVSAVGAGFVSATQVDAYRKALARLLGGRGMPISASGVLRAEDAAGPEVGMRPEVRVLAGPRWRMAVDDTGVTVWLTVPDGAPLLPPVRVWPAGPDVDGQVAQRWRLPSGGRVCGGPTSWSAPPALQAVPARRPCLGWASLTSWR